MADIQENIALQISYQTQLAAGDADEDAVPLFNEVELADGFTGKFFDALKKFIF